MPRTCTVCTHPEREAIDRQLVEGGAFPALVAKYRVSKDALSRHKANHLPAKLAKAYEAEDLLRQVRALQSKTLSLLLKAEAAGELRTAISAIREARGNVELLAKLQGELDDTPTVNVLISPQWVSIRTVLLEVLTAYPEARSAVAGELLKLDKVRSEAG